MSAPLKAIFPDRLDFVLPDFTRVCWASDAARSLWEPRFRRIAFAWREIEWRSPTAGIRDCCLVRVTRDRGDSDLFRRKTHALQIALLPPAGVTRTSRAGTVSLSGSAGPAVSNVVVGTDDAVRHFSEAWEAQSHEDMGRLLG